MAGYAIWKSNPSGNGEEFHVGDGSLMYVHWTKIHHVQMDGDELVRACDILGRPLPKMRVFTFVDQDARTIVANWR